MANLANFFRITIIIVIKLVIFQAHNVNILSGCLSYRTYLIDIYIIITVQISNALTGTESKELLRKLPKFIYDDDKALEVSTWFYN